MIVDGYLRTKDLANAVQISVQQVRNYEARGFLPPVERSPTGYRRYTRQHLAALKTARQLIGGFGAQHAQQIMQAAHQDRLSDALALIDERHADLAATRHQLDHTLAALSALAAHLPPQTHGRVADRLRVGAAARRVGVRVSALRFWEQQGLLHPVREHGSNYRVYDRQQLRRLHIVALLRQANYDFDTIHNTLDELEAGQPDRALAAVEQRRSDLARLSWRCLEASAALYAYVREFLDQDAVRSIDAAAPQHIG